MLCDNCKKREGTTLWGGESSATEVLRRMGDYPMWCEKCCLEAQIKRIEERYKELPKLKKELDALSED